MNWKEFFKPTLWKILTFIIILVVVAVLSIIPGGEWVGYGFPLYYLEHFYGMAPNGGYSNWSWHYVNLVIDVIWWYLITCGIFALLHKKK